MTVDDLLRTRRLSKRIKLLSSIEPSSVGKEQSSELMLMIMESAEELDKIASRYLNEVSKGCDPT
ncbi:hypothetical protein [Vibrio parahaemolyticus]|uniref:hypothetical protein n=1 Tax=Vibrio parahaemolyticus TaxID=670 RepID=UPI0015F3B64F|nr:hypothetical protein [Vibrio parahaemolyticus]EJB0234185.1 hypothetical protein [Vibrio vulnificus]ELX4139959.1 hypothetical protein [Vibrio vulnificus]MBA5907937.1 hypothetical protein [Vibrio parahaemolyticus]